MDTAKKNQILQRIINAVVDFNEEEMVKAVQESFDIGMDPKEAILEGLVPGMEQVGQLYESGKYFIPELIMSTDVLYTGLEMLKAKMPKDEWGTKGTIIIGVVEGDIHDIGKNIVKTILEVSGFKVRDLGNNVPLSEFLAEHKKLQPDIVCLSTMMTTTMGEIRKVIKRIKQGDTDVIILVGGAPMTDAIAERWGADARPENAHMAGVIALEAIRKMKEQRQDSD